MTFCNASVSPALSLGSTSSPFSPSCISSAHPPTRLAIAQQPQAIASINALGMPSLSEQEEDVDASQGVSDIERARREVAIFGKTQLDTPGAQALLLGPPPTISNFSRGPLPRTRSKASINKGRFFSRRNTATAPITRSASRKGSACILGKGVNTLVSIPFGHTWIFDAG